MVYQVLMQVKNWFKHSQNIELQRKEKHDAPDSSSQETHAVQNANQGFINDSAIIDMNLIAQVSPCKSLNFISFDNLAMINHDKRIEQQQWSREKNNRNKEGDIILDTNLSS